VLVCALLECHNHLFLFMSSPPPLHAPDFPPSLPPSLTPTLPALLLPALTLRILPSCSMPTYPEGSKLLPTSRLGLL